jgi:hypothetical protein
MNSQIQLSKDHSEILGKIMSSQRFRVQCKSCETVIESLHQGDFRKCNCGLIGIDGGKNVAGRRLIGDLSNMNPVE